MKDEITTQEEDLQDRKTTGLQKRISLRYWIGWSGGYSRSKKKA